MTEQKNEKYTTNLEFYERLVATVPEIKRKGASMPYTSHNGHMFSLFGKEGKLGLRLPKDEREQFLGKYGTKLFEQYGSVMKEYVEVPDELLQNTEELKKYFEIGYVYVSSLKLKPTGKK